jgi:hypothetical protein
VNRTTFTQVRQAGLGHAGGRPVTASPSSRQIARSGAVTRPGALGSAAGFRRGPNGSPGASIRSSGERLFRMPFGSMPVDRRRTHRHGVGGMGAAVGRPATNKAVN